MRKPIKEFLEMANNFRRTNTSPLSLQNPKALLEWIEDELSPENLTCDGEASNITIRYRHGMLIELKMLALLELGEIVEPMVGEIIRYNGKKFEVLKISRVNYKIKCCITGDLYVVKRAAVMQRGWE